MKKTIFKHILEMTYIKCQMFPLWQLLVCDFTRILKV